MKQSYSVNIWSLVMLVTLSAFPTTLAAVNTIQSETIQFEAALGTESGQTMLAQQAQQKWWVIVLNDPRTDRRRQPNASAGYRGPVDYTGDPLLARLSQVIVKDHALLLREEWPIDSLKVHCLVVAFSKDEGTTLSQLSSDRRVRWVQAFQEFTTLAMSDGTNSREPLPPAKIMPTRLTAQEKVGLTQEPKLFSDPYFHLQSAFSALKLDRLADEIDGNGVSVAIIDSGVQTSHADLASARIEYEDLVGSVKDTASSRLLSQPAENHGTAIAGVIVAQRNNGVGIAGVAPGVSLIGLRGCWGSTDGQTRCNTLSLAKSLQRVIELSPDILNLSLTGPKDPLLEALLEKVLAQGTLVVTAYDPQRNLDERFPRTRAGIFMAAGSKNSKQKTTAIWLLPGDDIITVQPINTYAFLSGSSLSAAHLSGVLALLKQIDATVKSYHLAESFKPFHKANEFMDVCAFLQVQSTKKICQ